MATVWQPCGNRVAFVCPFQNQSVACEPKILFVTFQPQVGGNHRMLFLCFFGSSSGSRLARPSWLIGLIGQAGVCAITGFAVAIFVGAAFFFARDTGARSTRLTPPIFVQNFAGQGPAQEGDQSVRAVPQVLILLYAMLPCYNFVLHHISQPLPSVHLTC